MPTTNTLQLLHSLAEGDPAALEPVCAGQASEVRYPAAEHAFEDDPATRLESLAERGVLRSTFADRVLACPSCGCVELDYRQACPGCGSGRIERRVLYEHTACGCIRARRAFEADAGGHCPECEVAVARVSDELVRMGEMYRCAACGDRSDEPVDRLRCRGCDASLTLRDPTGQAVYRYTFDEDAREWLEWHLAVRERVVELLETRGYRTGMDVAVDGGDRHVHVHAADPVFEVEVAVSIRDEPAPADVEAIAATGAEVGATPLLVAMAGHVTDEIEARAERHDVAVLPVGLEATRGSLEGEAGSSMAPNGPATVDSPTTGDSMTADDPVASDDARVADDEAATDEVTDGATESATTGTVGDD